MYGTSPMFTMPVSSVDSGRSNDNYGNWNNPFVYLVWMWAFSMFGGNGLWGNRNGVGTVETQAITASQVDDIRAQVAAIRQGIECGDANIMRAVDQLADTARANQIKIDGGFTAVNQNLCSGFGSVNSNICDAKTAVLGALCNIEHNLAMQGCQFANQMQQCCCELKTAIGDVECSIEKGLLNQTIQLNQGLCGVNQNIQQTGTQIANGISNLGFTIQQQFCNTNSLIEANTRAVQAEGAMTRQLLVDQVKDAEISRLRGIVAENTASKGRLRNCLPPSRPRRLLCCPCCSRLSTTRRRPPAPRRLPNRQFRLPAFYRAGAFLNPGALPPLNIKPERRIDDNVRKYDARNAGRKSRRRRYGNASHVSRHAGHGFRHAYSGGGAGSY